MIPYSWLIEAQKRINPYINKTELTFNSDLNVYFKWENHQITGSFKLRGALNRILILKNWEIERGIITASAGNHGLGVAYAGKIVNSRVTVFASDHAMQSKLSAILDLGATIQMVAGGYGEAEQAAIRYATDHNATWISPYNDGQVVAGQSTIASEIIQDNPSLRYANWLVPVGGGGLISGIALICKGLDVTAKHTIAKNHVETRIIGIQPIASSFITNYYFKGTQKGCEDLPTLADGLSGPVEENSITLPLVKKYVDDILLVSEDEIIQGIRYTYEKYGERIEGSAAVGIAAIIAEKVKQRPAIIIISGGNISSELHHQLVG